MSNKTMNVRAVCPFYISDNERSVSCEGIIGCRCVNFFENKEEKEDHEYVYCATRQYFDCPVFQAINEKY